MSVFTPVKIDQKEEAKVHHSQYIRTENEPDKADPKPAETATPAQPEAK